eukprot:1764528-Prymnesium_polylepis.2
MARVERAARAAAGAEANSPPSILPCAQFEPRVPQAPQEAQSLWSSSAVLMQQTGETRSLLDGNRREAYRSRPS